MEDLNFFDELPDLPNIDFNVDEMKLPKIDLDFEMPDVFFALPDIDFDIPEFELNFDDCNFLDFLK